ncbi:NUDIX domain-containing protein [Candidatus Leptofilum sp.]|uniref:NUDIX domain-containing protein n=1 Tax=Candidatus Leptofilum sp. TaxID=3241576 RepID=UPI003B5C8E9E
MGEKSSDWPPKKVVCVGTIVRKENKVLWIRQAKGASLAGQWSIPWGIVEANEQPEEAALRETLEEGGIAAAIDGFIGYQNFTWQGMIGLIYLCHHVEGVPTSDGHETDQAGYFSLAELEALQLQAPIDPWCLWLVRRVLSGDYALIPFLLENPNQPKGAFF